jgi:UDP-sulfoquinovose synthase
VVVRADGRRIDRVDNPRKEASDNELAADNRRLLDLGLEPTSCADDLLREVTEVAQRYLHRCDRTRSLPLTLGPGACAAGAGGRARGHASS